jgi:hypothetical protein
MPLKRQLQFVDRFQAGAEHCSSGATINQKHTLPWESEHVVPRKYLKASISEGGCFCSARPIQFSGIRSAEDFD